ncbi:PREDICTED: uncharacterized protein LOC104792972 isoform X2 [Camelina sativa]|uniref:Uncharacterized protein LOC104792972 isoform X2 n=1 Tax=Camelina sativa TaxID=90675 RepID=A0ABM0ZLT6_CAMSA|nr:PREDICTED: uncharacterized protein LOC104792972 isoform X2 [Camelina sativa]
MEDARRTSSRRLTLKPPLSHVPALGTLEISNTFGSSSNYVPNNDKRFVLVEPPTDSIPDASHIGCPDDQPSPTHTTPKCEPPLHLRNEGHTKEVHFDKCNSVFPVREDGPAHNLRPRKVVSEDYFQKCSALVLSTLDRISSKQVQQFLANLSTFSGREYIIRGDHFHRSVFTDILKPQKWISNLHIDLLLGYIWEKHSAFLQNKRITVVDSMFFHHYQHLYQLEKTTPRWSRHLASYAYRLCAWRGCI